MDIISLILILLTIAGLFIWNRAEGRQDIRHMDNKMDAIRELSREIHNEMKDFHYRLIEIERNRQPNGKG
jgi:hypothetical protein